MKIDARPDQAPRGLEVSAAVHARNREKKQAADLEADAARAAEPAVRVEIGKRGEEPPTTYGPEAVKLNMHVRDDETTAGTGLVLGAGAELKVNAHVGTLTGGGGTLVLEDGARLHLNLHADQAVASSGTVVIPAGTTVKASVHLRDDGGEHRQAAAPTVEKLQAAAAPFDSRRAVERAHELEAAEQADQVLKAAAREERKQEKRAERAEAPPAGEPIVDMRNLRLMLLRDLLVTNERQAGKPEGKRDGEARPDPRDQSSATPPPPRAR